MRDLQAWHLLWSTRASLLAEAGRSEEAVESYRRALTCDMNNSDRALIEARLGELSVDR